MNKGQFKVTRRTQKDHTLGFKMQVVEEVESLLWMLSILNAVFRATQF